MVSKTTFGQSQRWSIIRGILGVENEEKNNLNFANKVFNRPDVLILGGLNSGISLYMIYGHGHFNEKSTWSAISEYKARASNEGQDIHFQNKVDIFG